MIKIAITGPESSGKTTLARDLAERLDACMAEEYARKYLEENRLRGIYTMGDLVEIAQEQYALNRGRDCEKRVLVCDTEMTVIKIWAADKFGYCPGEITTLLERQQFDLVFLCRPDMPWEPDPLREDKDRREFLFKIYAEELFLNDENFVVLEGEHEKRMAKAMEMIGALLENKV